MFSFSTWLHKLRINVSRNGRRRAAKQRLDVECLEDRVVPSAYPTAIVYHPPVGPYQYPSPPSGSFGPNDIRTAYGINNIVFPGGVVGDGTGQTIAVVDAYDDPAFVSSVNADGSSNAAAFANSDLANFDAQYDIPNPPEFLKVNQAGVNGSYPGVDPTGGWEGEEALDVEWAHAIAPNATIILVEADNQNELFTAVKTAAGLPGVTVVSMSFGAGEYAGEMSIDPIFKVNGVTFLASAGDSGSPGGYPAYSPNVVAVGGTSLTLNADSTWKSETAWSYSSYYYWGTGGGKSQMEPEPAYQDSVQNSGAREMPDVAFDADPQTGVATYDSYNNGSSTPWDTIGGTSLSSPCWAGLIAITDQGRSLADLPSLTGYSQTLPAIYSLYATTPGDFHDIVVGNNDPNGGNQYNAGPGYDMTTGLGTPIANLLVPQLAESTDVAPVVTTTSGSLKFVIGEPAIAIDPGISLTADGGNLVGATVAVTGGHVSPDDVLAFTPQSGITGSYDDATGVLTLSGSAPFADYQAALASVTYVDANPLATAGTRTITFTVNDGLLTGSGTSTITLNYPNPVVSPNSLPAAKVGVFYSQAITASDGVDPFKFTISAGALPAGLTLTAGGLLSGTPTAGGSADFTVKAADSSPPAAGGPYSGTRTYVLTVAQPTLVISPSNLSAAQVAVNYSETVTVAGGTAPYTFSAGGTVPAGMTFDASTGVLSGRPTAGGPCNITIQVRDSSTGTGPYTTSKTYTLTVSPPTITFSPTTLPADKIGVPYSVTISASGGTLPLSNITIVNGTPPAGLSFDGTTGILSGTPTAAGTFNFYASITDSSTGTGPYTTTEAYTLGITAPTLTFSPSSLPSTQTGAAYNTGIALSGGSAPYTYAVPSGTLPAGLTLDSTTGVISGVPTRGGTVSVAVTATDSSTGTGAPFAATKTYSIAVNAPTITFNPTTLSGA